MASVKALKTSVVSMASKHILKATEHFKNILMSPKDEDQMQETSGIIYLYKCQDFYCDKSTKENITEHLVKGLKNT